MIHVHGIPVLASVPDPNYPDTTIGSQPIIQFKELEPDKLRWQSWKNSLKTKKKRKP